MPLVEAKAFLGDARVGNGIPFVEMLPKEIEDPKTSIATAEKAEARNSNQPGKRSCAPITMLA